MSRPKHADAVRQGVKQHTRALELLSEVGQINLELIRKTPGDADA
jgi:hypothetical protein